MAHPKKHPTSGVYQFRRAVPEDLRPILGKREEKRSLQTKDALEAKRRFIAVAAEVDAEWARLRAARTKSPVPPVSAESASIPRPKTLTEQEAHQRSAWLHGHWIALHNSHPTQQTFWRTELFSHLWPKPVMSLTHPVMPTDALPFLDRLHAGKMERWCSEQAEILAGVHNWQLDESSMVRLTEAMAAATQRASLDLQRVGRGEIDPRTLEQGIQPGPRIRQATAATANETTEGTGGTTAVTFTSILEGWWQEAKAGGRKPSTYESYRHTLLAFAAFMKADDARLVTPEHVLAFKNHRLATPSRRTGKVPSAKTVKDGDLSALKTLFGWAAMNRKVGANPALGITMKVGKAPRLRSKGFTDEEAEAILQAALSYTPGKETVRTAAAKWWVPWLCAFTGARVGELAQLRKEDVTLQQGRWVLRITPEAGTVKTNEARQVVLHEQIVSLGFPAFVKDANDGPLFLQPGPNGDVLGPLQGLKNRLAEFSRSVVKDPNVAPNHGWRHRFKTVGMEVGIAPRILDAIQGQAPASVADAYGEVTLRTIATAIDQLPPIAVRG